MIINARDYGHQHAEAYCLMKYQTKDGSETEWVWNSRDGVTPFCIPSRSAQEMLHVEWHLDRYAPDFIPPPGSRIFVDLTLERAREMATAKVEALWEDSRMPMKEHYPTKQEAVHMFVESWTSWPGCPALEVVE